VRVSAHTTVYQQPLPPTARDYLEAYWIPERHRLGDQAMDAAGIDRGTRRRWRELTDPVSPQYMLDQPGYYCIPFATLVSGTVA